MSSQTKFIFPTDSDELPQIRYVGYAGTIIGFLAIMNSLIPGVVIIVVSIALVLAFKPDQLVLDLNEKTITPRTFFEGEPSKFISIDMLEVKSTKISQRLNSRGSTSTIRYTLYQAFIISNKQRLLLGESRDKDKLIGLLEPVAGQFGVEIEIEK